MAQNNQKPTIIFTGGHHTSALEVAKSLLSEGYQIVWFGHRKSQWADTSDSAEYLEVSSLPITFIDLKAGKLYHTWNIFKLLRLPWGFIQAFYEIFKLNLNPKNKLVGIVTFGGYLGVPVVISGWLLNIPCISHEQTVVAGWANKIIACFARKIALTWQSSKAHFPRSKTVLTGLPLRDELIQLHNQPVHKKKSQIYITGGKQGSHVINQAVFDILLKLLNEYQVFHQTGSSSIYSDYQTAQEIFKKLSPYHQKRYHIKTYFPAADAASLIATSEIVVSRAGAHTIYELLLFHTKAVLIPIPWSSHSEQQIQSELLAKQSQAVILPQSLLSGNKLYESIKIAQQLSPKPIPVETTGTQNLLGLIKDTFNNHV